MLPERGGKQQQQQQLSQKDSVDKEQARSVHESEIAKTAPNGTNHPDQLGPAAARRPALGSPSTRPLGLSGTQAAGGARAPCANSELIHSSRHSPLHMQFLPTRMSICLYEMCSTS